ncbi:Flagellar hook-associated protein FlgL [Rhodovulum sp. PH10]|uniref:flagellin n=1 Tax=Rhodovulum sp. PH10 TaxID=1187851 RepID=UPI00027C2387|nr:flagellin [Rhodovulum sp. PH10]EJW11910.1 Flagellar hook-associated protein FlgL [Rhodovulum sp. PH10]
MIGRVATFALNDRMISAALQAQAETASLQLQQASGKISEDFGGLGGTSRRVLDLQTSIRQSQSYSAAATGALGRIEVMYSAASQMTDLLTSLRADLTAASTATDEASVSTLASSASQGLAELAALLNTNYEGRYLFAGAATDTAPVDLDAADWPTPTTPSTASTAYYRGDDQIAAVKVGSEQTVQYGVTADAAPFEQALRAFSLVAGLSGSSVDPDTLTEALDLALSALDGITAIQTKLSFDAATMERAVDTQTEFQDQASGLASDLTDVDLAAVTAELSVRQAQLEASYSALATIQKLSLLDYLR